MIPTEIKLHQQSRVMQIVFEDGRSFELPYEYLRVYSPSAEVQGHGPGQEILQTGKRDVDVTALEPIGNYAVLPHFSDGHESGIFTWDYLYKLGNEHDALWQDYLNRLHAAGFEGDSGREPGTVLPGALVRGGVCGSGHSH